MKTLANKFKALQILFSSIHIHNSRRFYQVGSRDIFYKATEFRCMHYKICITASYICNVIAPILFQNNLYLIYLLIGDF